MVWGSRLSMRSVGPRILGALTGHPWDFRFPSLVSQAVLPDEGGQALVDELVPPPT